LADRLDHMMTVALVLGNPSRGHCRNGRSDRDVEDLAIRPRVRDLVSDARVREVLDEFDEAVPRATSQPRPACPVEGLRCRKRSAVANTAITCELAGWCWSLAVLD
jgi:hypothetical protein